MKRFLSVFMVAWWCCACLAGCGLISAIMGTSPETAQDPPIQHIINFLGTLPGIGTMVASGLGVARWGWVEVQHSKLISAGKKDANNNGVDDDLEKPSGPSGPTPAIAS